MSNKVMKRAGAVTLALSAAVSFAVHAKHGDLTLAVTMTNDPSTNQIKVYDTATGALLQTHRRRGWGFRKRPRRTAAQW